MFVSTPENVTIAPFFTRFMFTGCVAVSFVVSKVGTTGVKPARAVAKSLALTEPRPVTMS